MALARRDGYSRGTNAPAAVGCLPAASRCARYLPEHSHMTKIIANIVLAAGFGLIPAVSSPATAYVQDNTRALMSPARDVILRTRGGRGAGVSKATTAKPRIENDLNKRGVGAGTAKGVP